MKSRVQTFLNFRLRVAVVKQALLKVAIIAMDGDFDKEVYGE